MLYSDLLQAGSLKDELLAALGSTQESAGGGDRRKDRFRVFQVGICSDSSVPDSTSHYTKIF